MAGPDEHGQAEIPPLEDAEAERQRRIDVLRGLAEHTAPAPHANAPARASATPAPARAPRPSLAPPSHRGRGVRQTRNRWMIGIAAVLCVVVIAVVAFTRLIQPRAHVSTAPTHTGPVVIRPVLDKIGCPQDAAWSPDGTRVAVFGDNCGASDTMLNVYDVASGKLSAQTDLTTITRQAMQSYAPSQPVQLLPVFRPALWTKDYLFIPFWVLDPNAATQADAIPAEGLLGFNAGGVAPLAAAVGIIANHSGPGAFVRWDMNGFTSLFTTTFAAALTGPAPDHTLFSSFPPSLVYDLRTHGPSPMIPLSYDMPPPSDPGGPVGVSTGDNQITIWQPGTLTYLSTIPDTFTPASIVLFDTTFDAVQPPPFLFTGVTFEGRLVPPNQPAPDSHALAATGLLAPWLPIRDTALAEVLNDVENSAGQGVGPAAVAWRPDGTRLAYQAGIAIGAGGARAHDVRIYDCHTGQVLVTLTPPIPPGTQTRATNLLRWSPDGTRLLLLDRITATIVVWGKGQLPA